MIKNPAAMALGLLGGNKTKKRLQKDPDYYRRIGRKGNKAQGKKVSKVINSKKGYTEKP